MNLPEPIAVRFIRMSEDLQKGARLPEQAVAAADPHRPADRRRRGARRTRFLAELGDTDGTADAGAAPPAVETADRPILVTSPLRPSPMRWPVARRRRMLRLLVIHARLGAGRLAAAARGRP